MKLPLLLGALTLSAASVGHAQQAIDPAIFPKPGAGQAQHVFTLPPQSEESAFRVEIVAVKTALADCNRVVIGADLDEKTLDGWGYTYFEIDDVSPGATTLMGCPDPAKTEKQVEIYFGDEALQRYNSKVPLIVYAPEDLTIGYRIWQTDGTLHKAE